MIGQTELRIGNFVDVGGCFIRFESGDEFKHGALVANPIPITPEILIACGFGTDFEIGLPNGNGTDLFIEFDELLGEINCGVSGNKSANYFHPIKHLHQLQNLYYCLTGSELTYQQHKSTNHE